MIQISHTPQKGFALLITILTVGVIVSATLAIVELSRLQLKLSVDSRDAEVAFSAANAAKECGQYIRTTASSTIADGATVTFSCFDINESVSSNTTGIAGGSGGVVRRYTAEIDWGETASKRCSVVDIIAVYAPTTNVIIGGSSTQSLKKIISNYKSDTMTCQGGSECTIVAAAGYNATCNQKNKLGVLKREVLLEF